MDPLGIYTEFLQFLQRDFLQCPYSNFSGILQEFLCRPFTNPFSIPPGSSSKLPFQIIPSDFLHGSFKNSSAISLGILPGFLQELLWLFLQISSEENFRFELRTPQEFLQEFFRNPSIHSFRVLPAMPPKIFWSSNGNFHPGIPSELLREFLRCSTGSY